MNLTHPQLLIDQNRDRWQRLQKEAAQDRLLIQILKAKRKGENRMENNHLLAEKNLLTWRRHWQQLLVGLGLMAALLLMRS
jgi:hypothetical protein